MLLILYVVVVLATSFLCSLSEAALLSVSRLRLHSLAKTNRSAQIVLKMKDDMDHPIAAILFLNTVANTGGAALAGREYARMFGGEGMLGFTVGFTVAVLALSELLPKSLGVQYSLKAILKLARPLQVLVFVMRPVTFVVAKVNRLFGNSDGANTPHFSLEDLQTVARLAHASKTLEREEQMIIDAAARLPKLLVGHIMIHRPDMVYLSLADDEEDIMLKARRSMHSRVPLCHHDLDSLVGIASMKEVLWRLVSEPEDLEDEGLKRIIGESIRDPLYVSPELEVSQLLQQFSLAHEHMAIVVDEAESVVGMVTLEDVVEELIGEVDDEYDHSPALIERVSANHWRFGGGTNWADAAKSLELPRFEKSEDHDLDGRFDLHDLAQDKLPGKMRTGAVFTVGTWRFKISRMRRGKVLYLDVARMGHQPESSLSESSGSHEPAA